MPRIGSRPSSALSRRKRAELWVAGSRSAEEIPDAESKISALARLYGMAAVPERGIEALKLLHEIVVEQIDLLLQVQDQEDDRLLAVRVLNQYVDLYDFAPTPYLSIDWEGQIITANHATGALFECSAGQLVGVHLAGLFEQFLGHELWAWAAALRSTSGSELHEVDYRRANRHPRRLQASSRFVESSQSILIALTDITHTGGRA